MSCAKAGRARCWPLKKHLLRGRQEDTHLTKNTFLDLRGYPLETVHPTLRGPIHKHRKTRTPDGLSRREGGGAVPALRKLRAGAGKRRALRPARAGGDHAGIAAVVGGRGGDTTVKRKGPLRDGSIIAMGKTGPCTTCCCFAPSRFECRACSVYNSQPLCHVVCFHPMKTPIDRDR